MSITRANVEREACNLVGRLMSLVGLAGGVFDGTNPDLNAPIRDGLTRMGYSTADPITVADADLVALDQRAIRRLMEWSELFTLEQVDRDWWRASASPSPGLTAEILASVRSRVVARIAALKAIVMTPYQSQNVPIAMGEITIGSRHDSTLPPAMTDIIAPWRLRPDGLWIYGRTASAYWGWDEWEGDCP